MWGRLSSLRQGFSEFTREVMAPIHDDDDDEDEEEIQPSKVSEENKIPQDPRNMKESDKNLLTQPKAKSMTSLSTLMESQGKCLFFKN